MKFTNIKYFGTFSGVIVGIFLMFVSFILRLNVLFINAIGKIPIYLWFVLVLIFILFSAFNKAVEKTILNRLYFILAIISFVYLNSMFQWSVECCPDKYDSMSDWNASKGLTWIVSVPITFFILIFQGLAYDLLSNRNLVQKKNI
jgi:uncharacterized membrane protein